MSGIREKRVRDPAAREVIRRTNPERGQPVGESKFQGPAGDPGRRAESYFAAGAASAGAPNDWSAK
jgi:hypothetical protein